MDRKRVSKFKSKKVACLIQYPTLNKICYFYIFSWLSHFFASRHPLRFLPVKPDLNWPFPPPFLSGSSSTLPRNLLNGSRDDVNSGQISDGNASRSAHSNSRWDTIVGQFGLNPERPFNNGDVSRTTPVTAPSTTTSAATSATRAAAAAPRTAWPHRQPREATAASGSAGKKTVANSLQRPFRVVEYARWRL